MIDDRLPNSLAIDHTVSASVDAPPAGALAVQPAAVPADLLNGGEVVILAIKPSLWSVAFAMAGWVGAAAFLIAAGRLLAYSSSMTANLPLVEVVVTVVALRFGMALMQWVSRVYVLTNRRIMRIRGVFQADVFACPLVNVINTGVVVGPHEAVTRLGTIRFNTGDDTADGSWYHVSRPHDVHAEIRRAIERALDHHI